MMVSRSGLAALIRKCAAAMVSSSPGWVLAASHTRAVGERGIELAPRRQIDGRRRRVGLEVADVERARDAELGEALGEPPSGRTRSNAPNSGRPPRPPPPALEARRRYAAIDEHQGNVPGLGLQHQVGPDLRLDQHGEIGAPMLQEALHEAWLSSGIYWRARPGQPCPRQSRRGDGGGGQQDAELGPFGGDGLDHRQRGIGLADARRMEPDEEARGPWRAREAVALGPGRAPLCRASCASEDPGRERRRGAQNPVGLERQPRLGGVLLVE